MIDRTSRVLARLALVTVIAITAAAGSARADEAAATNPAAEAANDKGKELYKNQDYQGAAAKFREAIGISPDARYYFNLCATLEKAGDYDGALEACDAVYEHSPGDELKGKTGQRAASVRAAKKKRDAEVAANGNGNGDGSGNGNGNGNGDGNANPPPPPPPDETITAPASSADYRWEFGGEVGPLLNRSLSNQKFAAAGGVLKLHANWLVMPKRNLGLQFYAHFGNIAAKSTTSFADIPDPTMSVANLGAAVFWNHKLWKTLYVTPLIGLHLGLIQVDPNQSESFAMPGLRTEVSFEYVISGKHVLYFTPLSINTYAAAAGQVHGTVSASEAGLDTGGVTFAITFGYAYRTTKNIFPGSITLE